MFLLVSINFVGAQPQADSPPTRLRGAHQILIQAQEGDTISAEIGAISASIGYSDWLSYRLFSPEGEILQRGTLKPGDSTPLRFRARSTGVYVLEGDPGQNAFTFDAPEAAWVISPMSQPGKVSLIDHARRLYFFVPQGLEEFTIALGGAEAARVSILRPDGQVAAAVDLEYVKPQEVTVQVGDDGSKNWSFDCQLQEDLPIGLDQRIPPYLSEQPLTGEALEKLAERGSQMFDMLPSPRQPAMTPGGADEPVATLRVADQLELTLSAAGQIVGVRASSTDLQPEGEGPFSGFMVPDHERGMTLWPAIGRLEESGRKWHLVSDLGELSLRLHASFISGGDHIAVNGELRDYSGEDRAVSLYFAIPIGREELAWWDDIDHRRPVQAHSEYGNWEALPAGANNVHSVYPFACVAGAGGLAMGVPMDRPVLHRLGYNAPSQQFFLCLDFALTQATAKFPARAPFHFVIYPVDPNWGFRSAADRYYRIYPEFFVERSPQGALTSGTIREDTPAAAELGFAYNWSAGRDPENVANSREHGLVPLLYDDSMRYYIFLTFPPEQTPSREQMAEDMAAFVNAAEPLRLYLERQDVVARLEQLGGIKGLTFEELSTPEGAAHFRMLNQAAKRSAFHDAEGRLIPTYYNSAQQNYKHYRYNIHSARILCNPDPDIPGGYGRFLLEEVIGRRFDWMEAHGTRLEGVSLDNYFVNAKDLDYRREHFAYADYPLTFAADHRPVILGGFCMYEFTKALAKRLRAEGGCVAANTGRMRFPFAATWVDVNLFESGLLENQVIGRTLAYHRPVVSLPVQPHHREDPWIKSAHLRMACFPGGGSSLLRNQEVMALYGRYMPALKKMAEAGWEPLTHASTGDADVLMERFGSWQTGDLCFSLVNRSQTEKLVYVKLDMDALGMTTNGDRTVEIRDLVSEGQAVAPMDANGHFGLKIAPGDTIAVELAAMR